MTGRQKHRTRRTFGAVRRLPSGRYQASFIGPDGVRHGAPHTFTAKIDADGWLSHQRVAVESDRWETPKPRSRPLSLAVYAEDWLAGRDLKPNTRLHYRWALDLHILPVLGDALITGITPAMVRSWHADLHTGPTAKAHCYALLKSILATAVEEGLVSTTPCKIKGASKVVRSRDIRPATLAELHTLTDGMPERLQLLVPLAAWCALRFGEITELRRKDLDLRAGVLHIRRGVTRPGGHVTVDTPKTQASVRDVHIPPHILPAIRQHFRKHAQTGADGLLFYGGNGGHLAHASLLYHFQRASTAAGRPDLTPHALRHTGAVFAAQSGATLAELMARLGHTTPEMAMRYQHASAGRDKILAQQLSQLAESIGTSG